MYIAVLSDSIFTTENIQYYFINPSSRVLLCTCMYINLPFLLVSLSCFDHREVKSLYV